LRVHDEVQCHVPVRLFFCSAAGVFTACPERPADTSGDSIHNPAPRHEKYHFVPRNMGFSGHMSAGYRSFRYR
jgi:hypothetical protein